MEDIKIYPEVLSPQRYKKEHSLEKGDLIPVSYIDRMKNDPKVITIKTINGEEKTIRYYEVLEPSFDILLNVGVGNGHNSSNETKDKTLLNRCWWGGGTGFFNLPPIKNNSFEMLRLKYEGEIK